MYSSYLFYTWFGKIKFEENVTEFPDNAIRDWPISLLNIEKVNTLCIKMIESDNNLILQTGEFKSSLFKNEVFKNNTKASVYNVDKYIALVAGNILYNSEKESRWFNSRFNEAKKVFDLISRKNIETIPQWITEFLCGFDLTNTKEVINLSQLHLYKCNFSNSKLYSVDFSHSRLYNANFSNCDIIYCDFGFSKLREANFFNTKIEGYSKFALSSLAQGVLIPYTLLSNINQTERKKNTNYNLRDGDHGILVNFGSDISAISYMDKNQIVQLATTLGQLLKFGYSQKFWKKEQIFSSIKFNKKEDEIIFSETINNILID